MQRALWLALPIVVTGCSLSAQITDPDALPDPTDPAPGQRRQIDEYIASLPYLPVDPPAIEAGSPSPAERDGEYSCSTQRLRETRQDDRIVAYAANSDALYPGALISADAVRSGLFTQIVLPRAPVTISVSLENLAGAKQARIAEPSLSSYRDALAGILDAEITGATPASLYAEIEAVHSESQLDMALGVQASWALGIASLRSCFDWSNHRVRSRYLVRYTQAYYTVDLDAPGPPSALLSPGVTLADVQARMDAQRPPAYVASVTYGRMVLFSFESQYSAEEMAAALDVTYAGGVDLRGDVSVTYKDMLSQSKITSFVLGGDAGAAVQTIDSYEALLDFIKAGGNYSRQSPGAPIAYKLAYLKDSAPARMSFTTDYEVKNCVRVSQQVRVTLRAIAVDTAEDSGDDLEIYGQISVEGADGQALFDKTASNYVTVHEGQAFGGAAAIAETVIAVTPQAGQAIRLRAHLVDQDTLSGDDDLGTEVVVNPFETGWRKDVTVTLTGSGARVRVEFSLAPI